MYKEIVTKEKTYKAKITFSGHKLFDNINRLRLIKATTALGEDFDTETIANLIYVALKVNKQDVSEEQAVEIIDELIETKGFEYLITLCVELITEYFGIDSKDAETPETAGK